jgi:FKBP-type peptidyl-prolyl cis-trans isomerase FklB
MGNQSAFKKSREGVQMKLGMVAVAGILLFAGEVNAGEIQELKSQKDKMSYIIGMDLGKNFQKQEVEINADILAQGIKDGISGGKPLLSEQEVRETLAGFQAEMTAKQMGLAKKRGEKNKKEGEAFLAENQKKEGVKTLPSGLQYKVIKAGTGDSPKLTDEVTAHYLGTLIDGTEFDSSYRRGKPENLPVNGVIPGWTEALQLMQVGAKWQLFVPSNLAYGERGAGRDIGPNATLIFEIELISIPEKK